MAKPSIPFSERFAKLRADNEAKKRAKVIDKNQQAKLTLANDLLTGDGFEKASAALSAMGDDSARVSRYTKGNVTLDESQIAALEGMLSQRFAALIGYAGSGKTTVLSFLVDELKIVYQKQAIESLEYDNDSRTIKKLASVAHPIRFAAYTGRASEIIALKMPKDMQANVSTIHKLLGYYPESVEVEDGKNGYKTVRRFVPTYDANNKLPYQCIVLDEAGMIPPELWNNLLAAIRNDCRVYLVGDISQLPPIMGLSPLPLAMLHLPTFELAKIHRQALDSPIIANATNIREGRLPKQFPGKFLIGAMSCYGVGGKIDAAIFRHKVVQSIKTLYESGKFSPWSDMVLVPMAKRENTKTGVFYEASAGMFNMDLRALFNPDAKRVIIQGGMRAFDVSDVGLNDKLMITKNGEVGEVSGGRYMVTNGMQGRVTHIEPNPLYRGTKQEVSSDDLETLAQSNSMVRVDFDAMARDLLESDVSDTEEETETTRQCSHIVHLELLGRNGATVILRTAGDFSNLLYAYACTVHKSQGGEFNRVLIALCGQGTGRLLSRELLYTAVTRAKESCIIVHDGTALAKALKLQNIKGNSLEEKARSVMAMCQVSGAVKPIMPRSEKLH